MSDIINCYHKKFSGGIGDLLKGSIYLYKKAMSYGLTIDVDWRQHPINDFITSDCDAKYDPEGIIDIEDLRSIKCKNSNNWYDNMKDWIDKIIEEVSVNKKYRPATVSSWFSDLDSVKKNTHINIVNFPLSNNCKKFMQKKIKFNTDIREIFNNNQDRNYTVIHFRLGDRHTLPNIEQKLSGYDVSIQNNYNLKDFNHDYEYYYYLINKQIKENNLNKVIIMSDSNNFKKFVKEQSIDNKHIKILHFNSTHTAKQPGLLKYTNYEHEQASFKYTALDLKYLVNSSQNITYSCYAWGSGFVIWPSKIFNIPLKTYHLQIPTYD